MQLNRLAREKSPYLLQHKHNPVDWYPWGEEAFEKARIENKPIFLSIGYSTCYWCHVMERDSFENQQVADVLNRSFVAIKLDREERPDIDQLYMDAVVAMTGRGGWPMSVFMTADRKPFFSGTFFPQEQFVDLCEKIAMMWTHQIGDIGESAESVYNFLKTPPPPSTGDKDFPKLLDAAYDQLQESFDSQFGGFGGAPKFPPSQALQFLLRYAAQAPSSRANDLADYTFECMARGGFYDHIGGGFHRYAVDRMWMIPHFEKMLYDNALLALGYLEASQALGKDEYRHFAREILDYMLRDLQTPEGGFASAEDAGDVGKEGEFYTWTPKQLSAFLTHEDVQTFTPIFGVSEEGNFEHQTTVINVPRAVELRERTTPRATTLRDRARLEREKRERPRLDDKVLTGWNGLAITAFARGGAILGETRYIEAAIRCAQLLRQKLYRQGELLRRYRDGDARFNATLEDYAYLVQGLLALQEIDDDAQWAQWAVELQQKQDELFWDSQNGGYFFARDTADLLHRKKEFNDNAVPSANGISAQNLFRLHVLTGDERYKRQLTELIDAALPFIVRYPAGYGSFLVALDLLTGPSQEMVVSTTDVAQARQALVRFHRAFRPRLVLSLISPRTKSDFLLHRGREPQGETLYYRCENRICSAPVHDIESVS